MNNYKDLPYFPKAEKLVKVLQTKTQNRNPLFFRVIVAYYFTMVASQMRINIKGWTGKGTIPVNLYALATSPSGSGKGHSTSLIENEVINNFKASFLDSVFPLMAEQNLEKLSLKRATRNGTDSSDEMAKLTRDFISLGALMFSFSEATAPAIKQMRQKLLMANAGSCNLIIDEVGANLQGSVEALHTYLELFDKGLIKDKLTKSSNDNVRFERIDGYTPANALLFGTPSKLLDGAKTEELLMELLEMGYARRCFFGHAERNTSKGEISVDDAIAQLFNNDDDDFLEALSDELALLADVALVNKSYGLSQDAIRLLVQYKLDCEKLSTTYSDMEVIKKSELEHRYFKVLKLAGAYAFIDGADEITPNYIEYAIALAQDSGEAFERLMTPQRSYVKLAKYLAEYKGEVTLADLDEDLPSFRGSKAQKDEMIMMATAWGYKNNIVIKKSYMESIMFLYADSIEETNLDEMIISYTNNPDMTTGYRNEIVAYDKLSKLFTANGYHWLNHHVKDNYRKEDNALTGFNLLVLDVDGTCSLASAKLLLKKYKAIYYTTKSHTDGTNRFRIILPMNYKLKLDAKDYKEFYNNIIKDLPFEVDEQCSHRTKKWLSHGELDDDGNVTNITITDGELFDVLPYIPKSAKNDERERRYTEQSDLDNLERWVMNNIGDGNRNNMLLRYALILVDNGFRFETIKEKTITLNNKLADKLDELELSSTVFVTVAGKMASQGKLVA